MKSTRQLLDLDQRLWRGNNTRTRLDDATLARDIAEDSIPGLTSKPRIFDAAIGAGAVHGKAIRAKTLAAAGAKPHQIRRAGVAVQALAAQRQQVKAQGFVKPQPPWLPRIAEASAAAASART